MDAWAGKLTELQMDDALAYVRSMATTVPPAPVVPWRAPQPIAPVLPAPGQEAAPAITGPIVIHPNGKHADLKMKDDRIVPLEEVAKAFKDKRRIVVIDARAPSDYLRLHVEGAVSVPYYDPHELDKIPNDGTWVIAYCACPTHASGVIVFLHGRGGSVTRAEGVAQQLREAGLPPDFAIVLVEGPYSTGFGHHWGDSAQEQATTRARLRARLRQVLGDGGPPLGRAQYIELDGPHTLPPEVLRALVAFATAT